MTLSRRRCIKNSSNDELGEALSLLKFFLSKLKFWLLTLNERYAKCAMRRTYSIQNSIVPVALLNFEIDVDIGVFLKSETRSSCAFSSVEVSCKFQYCLAHRSETSDDVFIWGITA